MLQEFRTQRIVWDRASNHIHNQINANKGDSNGRKLQVQILNGGQTEDLGGSTLSLGWRTKSNSFKGLDAFEVVDSSVGLYEIAFTSEMLYHVGSLTSSLVLITSTGRVESNPFSIHVISSTVDDETVQSENSFTALTQALVTVNQYDQKIEDLDSRTTAQLAQTTKEATRKRELEDLSETVLSAIEGGEGTSFNLLSIPQDESVTIEKLAPQLQSMFIIEGSVW